MAASGKNCFNCILMKKEFSTAWKGSRQKRKQIKYKTKSPIHIKRKMLSVNLSKDLRKKQGTRNVELRREDKVKIMRGKFRGKSGKVITIKTKVLKVYVEGIQVKKQDGSKVNVPLNASNLQILELNMSDKKRFKKMKVEKKEIKQLEKEVEVKKK